MELVVRISISSKNIPFFRLADPELARAEAEKVGFIADEFDEIENGSGVFNLRFADQKHPTVSKLLSLRFHRLERVLALTLSSLDSATIGGPALAVTRLTIAPNSWKVTLNWKTVYEHSQINRYNVWAGRLQSIGAPFFSASKSAGREDRG